MLRLEGIQREILLDPGQSCSAEVRRFWPLNKMPPLGSTQNTTFRFGFRSPEKSHNV